MSASSGQRRGGLTFLSLICILWCDHLKRKYKDDISYLEVDEENDDSKVDKSVGCGYQVRLLVHHKHQGRQQARLSRAENLKI